MGAHPEILKRLAETNFEAASGYGSDKYCASAKAKIAAACGCPDADVWFIVGGTQTNAVVTSSLLRRYQAVISADTGHIGFHEAGAIEYTGHKVILLPHDNGKINAAALRDYLVTFHADANHLHMAEPGMVYISHPTEYGTLYSKKELSDISAVCREYSIPLFLDGARLGYGLMSYDTDVSLEDIARLCDVFYIGGTKVGALCGEAVVFTKKNMPDHFLTLVKQQGALIAKGRLLGVQFDTLFTDELYMKISRHAIDMAQKLKDVLRERGYEFFIDSPTNQQFIVIENGKLEKLREHIAVGFWEKYDDSHTVIRLATSWATTDEDLDELKRYI
jgi:threonine aldolase